MADDVWYYLENRQQRGPVSFAELQGLVASGAIRPGDLVWSPEMSEWTAASTVPGLVPAGTASASPAGGPPPPPGPSATLAERSRKIFAGAAERADRLPHVLLVDRLLGGLQRAVSEERLDRADGVAKTVGHWAYLIAVLLLAVLWIVLAIRQGQPEQVLYALAAVAVGTIAHYIAVRFLEAGRDLIAKTPSRLLSKAFLQCFALLAFLAALVLFVLSIDNLIDGEFFEFFRWLATTAIAAYAGWAALSPAALNVTVGGEAGAGEEAVGVFSFLLKLGLRLVPFSFGALAVAGVMVVLATLVQAFAENYLFIESPWAVLGVALIPFFAYLAFLLYYLALAVIQALLSLAPRS